MRAAKHHGVGTFEDLTDYHRQRKPPCRPLLAELVDEGRLVEATVEGWKQPAYVLPDTIVPRRITARALLSPFDSVVWNHDRTERLFGFRYRIEIYVPPPKRQYGYYVLPFLLGDELITPRAISRPTVGGARCWCRARRVSRASTSRGRGRAARELRATSEVLRAPLMGIDANKRYTAVVSTSKGDMTIARARASSTEDGELLRVPRGQRLLRRAQLPPHHSGIHGPGRLPRRQRSRRARLPVRRRVAAGGSLRDRLARDGQRRARHQRLAVLLAAGESGVLLRRSTHCSVRWCRVSRSSTRCNACRPSGGDRPKTDVVINSVTIAVAD